MLEILQDAQEFSKLFMALLEKDPAMCHFIQDQFMGRYEYLTWLVINVSRFCTSFSQLHNFPLITVGLKLLYITFSESSMTVEQCGKYVVWDDLRNLWSLFFIE